jgi:chitinase
VVTPLNDAPLISGLANATTASNRRLDVNFTVFDAENDPVTVSAGVVPAEIGTVTVTGTGATRTLTFQPSGVQTNGTITVTATDGTATTTASFSINVTAPLAPSISNIPNQTGVEDALIQIPFTVNSAI